MLQIYNEILLFSTLVNLYTAMNTFSVHVFKWKALLWCIGRLQHRLVHHMLTLKVLFGYSAYSNNILKQQLNTILGEWKKLHISRIVAFDIENKKMDYRTVEAVLEGIAFFNWRHIKHLRQEKMSKENTIHHRRRRFFRRLIE